MITKNHVEAVVPSMFDWPHIFFGHVFDVLSGNANGKGRLLENSSGTGSSG